MNIQDQAALVTGGSRGLGKELGKELVRRGARVVLIARTKAELDAAVREVALEARSPGTVHGLAFDVAAKDDVHRIAGAAAALVGPPSIVIHNASSLGPVPMPLLLDTECEDFEAVLAANLVGPFRLTKALAGSMTLQQRGVVLFVSSDAAVNAYSGWGAYGVSKAAQDHLARSFAAELDPIRFLAVDPGEMDTKMHADAMPEADRSVLARPADVARRFVRILERAESIPNGSRISAADFDAATGAVGKEFAA
jgi:NAD(P)-dependent dehydrogenase (short-subunit alcohol dehydrogenase family)